MACVCEDREGLLAAATLTVGKHSQDGLECNKGQWTDFTGPSPSTRPSAAYSMRNLTEPTPVLRNWNSREENRMGEKPPAHDFTAAERPGQDPHQASLRLIALPCLTSYLVITHHAL